MTTLRKGSYNIKVKINKIALQIADQKTYEGEPGTMPVRLSSANGFDTNYEFEVNAENIIIATGDSDEAHLQRLNLYKKVKNSLEGDFILFDWGHLEVLLQTCGKGIANSGNAMVSIALYNEEEGFGGEPLRLWRGKDQYLSMHM